jgi:hypothetical protein
MSKRKRGEGIGIGNGTHTPPPNRKKQLKSSSSPPPVSLDDLCQLVDFSSLTSVADIDLRFDQLARALLHEYRIVLLTHQGKTTEFEILELEFYLHHPGKHEDPFTHNSQGQSRPLQWYASPTLSLIFHAISSLSHTPFPSQKKKALPPRAPSPEPHITRKTTWVSRWDQERSRFDFRSSLQQSSEKAYPGRSLDPHPAQRERGKKTRRVRSVLDRR